MKNTNFLKRKTAVRAKIFGTRVRPRLSVYRSNKALFVQLVDDAAGKTLIGLNSRSLKKDQAKTKTDKARLLGLELAKLAKGKKITGVVFDRSGYKYHGRVKAVAEGAREGGLNF